MTKKRKAFKTSPSVRIPRAAVERLQESKAQAQAQTITSLEKAIHSAAMDMAIFLRALRDAVKLIDTMHQRAGKRPLPLLDGPEIRRLEEIRLLSIGV